MRESQTHSKMPDGRPAREQPKWRQDFPVDSGATEYVSRRDFAKFLVLTSGAFVVGQAWIGAQNLLRRARGKPPVVAVASVADVPVGSAISFRYPSSHDQCVLVRPDEETFLAYDQRCSHLACAVIPKVREGIFLCPCHEGYFDLGSGVPLAGPPRRPLPRITLEVRGGVVYATGVELRV